MEWQIGSVNVRVKLNLVKGKGQVNVIYPIDDYQMGYVKIMIDLKNVVPVTIETLEYAKGDKDAEKSAIN